MKKTTICRDSQCCTGCGACSCSCPKSCIQMIPDDEGFVYPDIDETKCIHCHICENVCPVNNPPLKKDILKGYIVRSNDPVVVENSASGGAFSALAQYILANNGIVYGVGYDECMVVRHFSIDKKNKDKLFQMAGSKYVQSELGTTYNKIKFDLNQNRLVCFSGTPCQVAGLKAFLRKDYENLITIDFVCHGVSSPLIFKKYIEFMENATGSQVVDVRFRNKTYGYHSSTMKVDYINGKSYFGSGRIDQLAKAYFAGACSRYACYKCPFKGKKRCSDFTLFDSWHVKANGIDDDNKGFTNVFVYSNKGTNILNKAADRITFFEGNSEILIKLDGVMINEYPEMHPSRKKLLNELKTSSFLFTMNKYFPITKKDKCLEKSKSILYKIGLLAFLKK